MQRPTPRGLTQTKSLKECPRGTSRDFRNHSSLGPRLTVAGERSQQCLRGGDAHDGVVAEPEVLLGHLDACQDRCGAGCPPATPLSISALVGNCPGRGGCPSAWSSAPRARGYRPIDPPLAPGEKRGTTFWSIWWSNMAKNRPWGTPKASGYPPRGEGGKGKGPADPPRVQNLKNPCTICVPKYSKVVPNSKRLVQGGLSKSL